MKKILFLIFIFIICVFAKDEATVFKLSDIPQDCNYIEIVGATIMGIKLSISIDYGQSFKDRMKGQGSVKKDDKYFAFNSMIDALNYFNNNGWEFKTAYAITMGNNNVYHYLLERKK